MERVTLALSGMTCGHCVATVRKTLAALSGVQIEQVGINTATVTVDTTRTPIATIVAALDDAGYAVQSTRNAA